MICRRHAVVLGRTIAAITVLSGVAGPARSWAADAAAPTVQTEQPGAAIEEIIVTAEKRSSTVQETPIAITALTSEQLEAQHVEEFQDLGSISPGVQMVPVSQTIQVNIRGVGSNFFDPRGETSVASSIDGFYYARPAQAGNTFFDVDRVEVLNGPQGTLYGRNAAAGAVNLITNQPADHFEGDVEAGVGNYDMREYAGMINIPIGDTLSIRASGKGLLHDGYVANYYDDAANNSARFSAKWKPTDALTAYFAFNYSGFDGNGAAPVSYPCDPVPYSNVVSQRCAPPGAPGGDFPLDGKTKTDLETYQLNLDYDLGFATVTSITGLMTQSIESDGVPNGTFFIVKLGQSSHDWSEELRIAGSDNGDSAGGFGWVAGGYYSTGNGNNTFYGLGLPTDQPRLPENTEAGFGQGTYGITDTIRATAGIRYTHDEKGVMDVYGSNVTAPFDRVNYRIGLEADVAKDSLVYATLSTGYVAGGADGGAVGLPSPPGFVPSIFEPEDVRSYEVGSKNTFLSGRLRVNGDFYYYTIKNYQSYNPGLLNSGIFGLQVQDIANATTYGAELSLAYALTPVDRFTAAGSLGQGQFDALKIDSFGFSRFGLGPLLISVPAGYPLTNLPNWDMRLGYSHVWALDNDATIEAGVNSHISGGYWVVPASNDQYDRQKSFTMTDLHVRYQMEKGLSIEGWVKNIENASVTNYAEDPGFHLYYPLAPRTYGFTVGYSF